VQLVSTSHYRAVVNAGRKGRRKALEIKAPCIVFQYNKFTMGIDMADKYLRYYSALRNTIKWPNLYAKTVHSSMQFCVQNTKHKQKKKV